MSRARLDLSVVLTGLTSDEETLARCLAGFAGQTLPCSRFELIVVGRQVPARLLKGMPALRVRCAPGRPSTAAEARNLALAGARAPVVLFWDPGWSPDPEALAYCRRFHARHRSDADTVRVHAVPHVSLRDIPVVRWRLQRGTFVPQPPADGVYAWPYFRCPGLSCKRALFDLATFDPAYQALDDLHLGGRLADRSALTVWHERFPLATIGGRHSFGQACAREYLEGFYRQVRLRQPGVGRAVEDVEARFVYAGHHVRPDAELATLRATVAQLEASLADAELSFPGPDESDRVRLLFDLYDSAAVIAGARGWLDAEAGGAPRPPAALLGD